MIITITPVTGPSVEITETKRDDHNLIRKALYCFDKNGEIVRIEIVRDGWTKAEILFKKEKEDVRVT